MKKNTPMIVIIVVIAAIIAFFGGMKYQQSQGRANGGQLGARAGQRGQFAGRTGGNSGPIIGQIVSQDANSITVKLQDGSSKIVNVSSKTTFSKTDTAAKTDVQTGQRIAAFGQSNSDGSITADNIQLNPMFRQRMPSPTK